MRHKYDTRGIVLARSPLGETSALLTLVTPELGLVRARAQGLRASGAKLSSALTTFAESSLVLVRGKEGWRIAGAVLEENWFSHMRADARRVAARISGLMTRLVVGETQDVELFSLVQAFLAALSQTNEAEVLEGCEILLALRLLQSLGLDAGEIPGKEISHFDTETIGGVLSQRATYIARINHGLEVSGL